MKKLKILLVGVGGWGTYLWNTLRDYVDRELYEIVAVVDPFRKQAGCYDEIREMGLAEYDELHEFFSGGQDADLAVIAAPIPRHREQTVECLRNGVHVLCEKPAAALLSDLDEMIQVAKEENRILGIGFQWTFFDEILAMKKDLMEEKFGKILLAKSMVSWPRNRSYFESSWKGRLKNDQGEYVFDSVLSNATAHYLHNLLFLCGKSWNRGAYVKGLKVALYRAKDIENFDTVSLEGDLGDGIRLLYLASHAVDEWIDPIFEIRCEHGRFGANRNDERPLFYAEDSEGNRSYYSQEVAEARHHSFKLIRMMEAVQKFMETGKVPEISCDGETARPHLEVINRLAFGAEIHNFPKDIIKEYDTEEYQGHFVPGLSQEIFKCYQEDKPLSASAMKGIVEEKEVAPMDKLSKEKK